MVGVGVGLLSARESMCKGQEVRKRMLYLHVDMTVRRDLPINKCEWCWGLRFR